MEIEETVNGMRIDTFLADMETLSEEDTQHHKTFKRQRELQKPLVAILEHKNRLPD